MVGRLKWTAIIALVLVGQPVAAQQSGNPPEIRHPSAPATNGTATPGVEQHPAPEPNPALPPPPASITSAHQHLRQILTEQISIRIKDHRGATVTLKVPAAIHRPANAFRLYGPRPLTLRDRNRRRDLYRDAFLELATRPHLGPDTNAWDPVAKQAEWLASRGVTVELPGVRVQVGPRSPSNIRIEAKHLRDVPGLAPVGDAAEKISSHPAYRHFTALSRALGFDGLTVYADEPVMQALQFRALATDAAEQRLLRMGQLLGLEGGRGEVANAADPAMLEGYRAARAEFEEVRTGLWTALAQSLKKSQGRLLLSAVKQMVLSHLGFWAMFGHLGWQGIEGALNVEYQGQVAICLATVGCALAEREVSAPGDVALGLYAQFALQHRLTEVLKRPQFLELKPAGGKTATEWQVLCSSRCQELRTALAAGSVLVN